MSRSMQFRFVVLAVAAIFLGGSAFADNFVVDDDSVECPTASHATIQGAVDAAAATIGKDKIDICPGTYVENVVIGAGNEVDIKGAGPGSTIVHPVAGTAGPVFLASGAGKVKIKDLTVDGLSTMVGPVVTGIQYLNTEGEVKNTEVLNVRNPTGAAQGVGIRTGTNNGGNHKVKIKDNLISNYTGVGILGSGIGADLDVKNNTVMGPVLPRVFAPNGIQVSRGAVGKVEKNNVDNNPSPNPPGGAGSGIILFCSGPGVKVKNNDVTEADLGVSVVDTSLAKVEKNDISDSVFDGISLQFLGFFFGPPGCPNDPLPSPVEMNLVKDNTITTSGDTGISSVAFDVAAVPTNNRIEKNDISGSTFDGIHIFDGSTNTIEKNDIATSGSFDAVDDTVDGGTARTDNTWDKNDCATSSPAGLCD